METGGASDDRQITGAKSVQSDIEVKTCYRKMFDAAGPKVEAEEAVDVRSRLKD